MGCANCPPKHLDLHASTPRPSRDQPRPFDHAATPRTTLLTDRCMPAGHLSTRDQSDHPRGPVLICIQGMTTRDVARAATCRMPWCLTSRHPYQAVRPSCLARPDGHIELPQHVPLVPGPTLTSCQSPLPPRMVARPLTPFLGSPQPRQHFIAGSPDAHWTIGKPEMTTDTWGLRDLVASREDHRPKDSHI